MSELSKDRFLKRFGGVFEKSPWIASDAWDNGVEGKDLTASSLHDAMCKVFRDAGHDKQLDVIRAHPDLAGRLAMAGGLTAESTAEQASAGLDKCTPEEFEKFQTLNEAYVSRFQFPFIMAVRNRSRVEILQAFETRVENDAATEFEEALCQIEMIALLRLKELLP